MQLDVQARDFSLTPAINAHVQRRLGFALGSQFDSIQKIVVRLSDINGPRGGNDKRCQILISIPKLNDVVIEDTETDLYIAINRAADRANRTLKRKLSKQFAKSRKPLNVNNLEMNDSEADDMEQAH